MKIFSPKAPFVYAGCAVVLSLAIEIGWWADIPILRTILPGLPPTNPVTALSLIALGGILFAIALHPRLRFFLEDSPPTVISAPSTILRLQKIVLLLFCFLIIVFGIVQFILSFYGLPYRIDEWLFFPQMAAAATASGTVKIAPNTSLSLACLGSGCVAIILFPRKIYFAQIYAFITIVLCIFAVLVLPVALFVDVRLVYAASMSLPTAIGLTTLSLSILSISRKQGIFLMRAEYQERRVRLPIWVKMGFATVTVLFFLTLQSIQTVFQINQLQRDNFDAHHEMQMYVLVTKITTLLPLYHRAIPGSAKFGGDSLLMAMEHSYRMELGGLFNRTDSIFTQFRAVAAAPDVQSIWQMLEASRRIANATTPPTLAGARFAADSLYFAAHHWLEAKMENPTQSFLQHYVQNSQNLSRFIVISISGTIVLMLVVMGLTAFNISEGLLKIIQGTRSIATGDFEQTISIQAQDETAVVAHSFNTMAQQLSTMTNELHQQIEIQAEQAQIINLANSQLQEQNEVLNSMNIEKNELLGIVSHDLKNPIGAVRGFAELMAQGFIEPEQTPKIMASIISIADRMLELVRNLLDVNQMESGGMQFQSVSFDVAPMVASTVEQFIQPATTKNITLHLHNEAISSMITADEQAVRQVLDNIISNAVKYSPLGKNVFVRIKGHSSGDGDSTNAPMTNDQFLRIEVQDEGQGISNADMKKLFGKFARLTARPTGGEHSTGLGLSIVKKMVEAMNGRVWCESELGKGATFIVELPSS